MRGKQKIGDASDLENDGDRLLVDVDGREIAVFNIDGEIYAILNFCIHQGAPLGEGDLKGHMTVGEDGWEWKFHDDEKIIVCPWHGWMFDVTTGENIKDDRYRVPTYEVVVEDDALYIEL